MQYKGTKKTLPQIAQELNVDAVVEGAVLRSGDRVRITAQLLQARTDKHLWAEYYERDMRDILGLQREVARDITSRIQIKLTSQEKVRLPGARPVNSDAYEAYMWGRYFWNKRTDEGFKKGIEYFQQAIDKDSRSALGYAGLADSYLYSNAPPKEKFPKAKAAAAKAVEIDDSLAEGHAALAHAMWKYDWDFVVAEREFRRAIELNPSYSDAHHWYSHYLMGQGRFGESLTQSQWALKVDPFSLVMNVHLGEHYLISRQYDQAIEQCRKVLDMDANFTLAHSCLGQAYEQQGMYDKAISALRNAATLSGESSSTEADLAHAYAISGNRREALKILDN